MDKLGQLVSPFEVCDGGTKGLHGLTSGLLFFRQNKTNIPPANRQERLFFSSLDAGLVVWGRPDPFPTPLHGDIRPLVNAEGASIMLFNNVYNTNYVVWWPYEQAGSNCGSVMFRFGINMLSTAVARHRPEPKPPGPAPPAHATGRS